MLNTTLLGKRIRLLRKDKVVFVQYRGLFHWNYLRELVTYYAGTDWSLIWDKKTFLTFNAARQFVTETRLKEAGEVTEVETSDC